MIYLFIRFTVRVFPESLSNCVWTSFPYGFQGGMLDLIVLVTDHFFLFTLPRTATQLQQAF